MELFADALWSTSSRCSFELSNAAAAAGGAVEVAVEEGRVALVRMVPVTDA